MGLQRVGEVVQIPNVLAVELDQDISSLQAGFRRRRAVANIRETDAMRRFIEIGNAAEVGTIPTTATGAPRGSLGLSHALELGAFGIVRQAGRDLRDVSQKIGGVGR